MNKTLSDNINEIINDINSHRGDWDAQYLAEKRIELSTWLANLNEKIAEFEHQYYVVCQMAIDKDPSLSFAKAQNMAKAGDEYLKLRKAQGLEKAVVEMVRSINRFIRLKENEQELSRTN